MLLITLPACQETSYLCFIKRKWTRSGRNLGRKSFSNKQKWTLDLRFKWAKIEITWEAIIQIQLITGVAFFCELLPVCWQVHPGGFCNYEWFVDTDLMILLMKRFRMLSLPLFFCSGWRYWFFKAWFNNSEILCMKLCLRNIDGCT